MSAWEASDPSIVTCFFLTPSLPPPTHNPSALPIPRGPVHEISRLVPGYSQTSMPLSTTVVGSFPKPSYLNIPDWFNPKCTKDFVEQYSAFLQNSKPSSKPSETEELITRAIKETLQLQSEAGLDVISDGEMRRENYIYFFCRKLTGFDFHNLYSKSIRSDAATILAPRIVGELSAQESEPWVWKEWKNSQDLWKELPVKITLPGPMTIADSVIDKFYNNARVLGSALAKIINKEIRALVAAGCKFIQVSV